MDAVVRAVLIIHWHHVVRAPGLHPFRDHNPRLVWCDVGDAEVAKASSSFWNENPFAVADDVEFDGVNLSDEQWGSMAKDVIVVGSFACIDEIKLLAVCHPVLLSVVVIKITAIIECPSSRFVVIQTVTTAGHVTVIVVSKCQVESIARLCDGRFVELSLIHI